MLAEYLDRRNGTAKAPGGTWGSSGGAWGGGGTGGFTSQRPADSIGTAVQQPSVYGGSRDGILAQNAATPVSPLTDVVSRQRIISNLRNGVMQSPGYPGYQGSLPADMNMRRFDTTQAPGIAGPVSRPSALSSQQFQRQLTPEEFARDYANPTPDEIAAYQAGTLGQSQGFRPTGATIQSFSGGMAQPQRLVDLLTSRRVRPSW